MDCYGETVEKGFVASLAGVQILNSDRDLRTFLEELITHNVAAAKESLGNVWTMPREQKNGQDAFESKPPPKRQPLSKSNECLGAVLSVLAKCVDKCPLLTLQLPAAPGVESGNDRLIRRAVDSAVDALGFTDPEIVRNAVLFLIALVSNLIHIVMVEYE